MNTLLKTWDDTIFKKLRSFELAYNKMLDLEAIGEDKLASLYRISSVQHWTALVELGVPTDFLSRSQLIIIQRRNSDRQIAYA